MAAVRLLGVTPQRGADHEQSRQCDRRPDHAACGLRGRQQRRKCVEEIFGWLKTIALLRKTRHRGQRRVGWMFTFVLAVDNLVRIRNLAGQAA